MRSSTRLTSVVFQLTPTRTRCDLFIIANDKKEKIASGLFSPFLAQLQSAQDQITKGGYSIVLDPESGSDTSWFTKATVERFVRFVSTPEILERVYAIETEIIQIEEAIAMQNINDIGQSIVENHQRKSMGSYQGGNSVTNTNDEKAIVLYTPATAPSEVNRSCQEEGNSKIQLLKVLETRRTALQREQGMAFARAVAAGFDIDDIAPLESFSECFGALRFMEACSQFADLWRRKHETGQWLDIDASESLANQPDFSALNASGIIFTTAPNNHGDSNRVLASDNNGNPGSTNNADNPVQNGQQQPIHGQFPQSLFPPWPMHGQPGAQPVYQAYPVQGMPYYQPYAGNGLFFQPHQHPMAHSPSNFDPPPGQERQLSDVKDSIGSETVEINGTSLDDRSWKADAAYSHKSWKTSGGSNEKQQGMVIIRNINYITSQEKTSDGDASSDSHSDNDTESENLEDDGQDVIHQNQKRSSKSRQSHLKVVNKSNLSNDKVNVFEKEVDNRQWQAFQDCLLRGSDGGTHADKKGVFAMEKDGKIKKQAESDDPLAGGGRDTDGIQDNRTGKVNILDGSTGRKLKAHDDFIIGSQQNWATLRNSSDSLDVNNFEGATGEINRDSSGRMADETLIATFRSMSLDQGADRNTVDIDSEIPSKYQKKMESGGSKNKVNYEPNDLTLIPECRNDKGAIGYDRALDYELQVCAEGSRLKGKNSITDVKGGGIRKPERDWRSKLVSDSLHKPKTGGLVRKGSTSKTSTIEDARARAERLRSYKAELQKMKKEKDEAEAKRLESLRLARQKRIAARGGSTSAKPSTPSPQTKQPLPKISPTTNRSKFTDSGPGSSSPLQRSKVRTSLLRSSEPNKATKVSKMNEDNHTAGKRLTRSSSSLSDRKRENNVSSDSKASISRIRRLSEPKTLTNPPVTTMKAQSAEGALKRKLFEGREKNKVSAIINLDRSKAATLPGLKIRTPKPHVNSVHQVDADDNPIVEKGVVLEQEKPSSHPPSDASEAKPVYNNRDKGQRINATAESAPARVVSPLTRESVTSQIQKQSDYNKVQSATSDRDSPYALNTSTDGKPNQAPYAHVSSLEVPCTRQSEYGKATLVKPELTRADVRILVPEVKSSNMDKYQATSEKSSVKDTPKGLRRLLKFGKKSHTSSSMGKSIDSECTSGDGVEQGASSNKIASTSEAHTLKNLISQEGTSFDNAPQKSSRHFSLLSPFWSKTSEKKRAS